MTSRRLYELEYYSALQDVVVSNTIEPPKLLSQLINEALEKSGKDSYDIAVVDLESCEFVTNWVYFSNGGLYYDPAGGPPVRVSNLGRKLLISVW